MTSKYKLVPAAEQKPSLVVWVLYDATTDKQYIRMNPFDGSLAVFDSEEAAKTAKRLNSGTDYERCEYYSVPQPTPAEQGEPVIRKLGIMGAAFDLPTLRRAYTYSDQPNNTTAWKLGRVACKERSGGDFIDYGLQLLQHLQDEGFGVFEIDESDPTPQPTPEVAKLVEALEGLLAIVSESAGVAGYHLNGEIAEWGEFEEVEIAEEALALYRQKGGDV